MINNTKFNLFEPTVSEAVKYVEFNLSHVKTCGNVRLLCAALELTRNLNGSFIECGVFTGSTLFTACKFAQLMNIKRKFIGIDTFEGFPLDQVDHPNDDPSMFIKLFEQGKITIEHLAAAQDRLGRAGRSHLQSDYFNHVTTATIEYAKVHDIELIKSTIANVKLDNDIVVLHIDTDTYPSYVDCLAMFANKVIVGGVIVLDEYYSLKYPGARIAVDEFIAQNDNFVLQKFMPVPNEHERWCMIKIH